MLTLSPAELIILVIVLPVLGAIAGYAVAAARSRNEAGGMSVAELRSEFDAYQNKVDQHFATTGGLLYELSSHYQKICAHMAAGARDLGAQESAEIAQLRSGLLPLARQSGGEAEEGTASAPYVAEQPADDGPLEPPKDYATVESDGEAAVSSRTQAG